MYSNLVFSLEMKACPYKKKKQMFIVFYISCCKSLLLQNSYLLQTRCTFVDFLSWLTYIDFELFIVH